MITKEQCEKTIKGVCEGCGGKLEAIDTIDNSGVPTFWVGCNHCKCFRGGIESLYFEVARELVDNGEPLPYSHMQRADYEDTPERLAYYKDSQTAGLSRKIREIHQLLEIALKRAKEEG